jgi:uncharacterized protein (TIRG00374 family)
MLVTLNRRFAFKVFISLLMLVLIAYNVDLFAVITAIGSVSWWYWPLAIGLSLTAQIISAKRWHILSDHVAFSELLRQTLISNVYSFVVPSALAADLGKVIGVPKAQDGWVGATARIVVDKIIGFAVIVVVTLPALYFTTTTALLPFRSLLSYALLLFASMLCICLIPSFRNAINRWVVSIGARLRFVERVWNHAHRLYSDLRHLHISRTQITLNILLALVFQAATLASFFLIIDCLDVQLTFLNVILLSSVIQLSFFIPLGLAGVGVKDVAQVAFLMTLGVSKQQAVTMALVGYVATICLVLVGSFFFLRRTRIL